MTKPYRRVFLTAFRVASCLAFVVCASPARAQIGPEFTIPTQSAGARGIAAGPDGNVWFTETTANQIGRLHTGGTITEFAIPTTGTQPWSIVSGPGPALWFTQRAGSSVGRITTAGVISEFPLPTPNSQPEGIAVGPDGNLWVACYRADVIARVTPAGVVTEFPVPAAGPTGIARGPDGNLWATAYDSGEILRMTPAGVVTRYPLPDPKAFPTAITAGSDGALWFLQSATDSLGRIATDGTTSAVPLPEPGLQLSDITAGPDGSLWMGSSSKGRFLRITPAGRRILHPILPESFSFGSGGRIEGIATSGASVFLVLPNRSRIFQFQPTAPAVDFSPLGGRLIRAMTTSPSGEIWYITGNDSQLEMVLGRLAGDGQVTESVLPLGTSYPAAMAFGPDGKIWVSGSDAVSRFEPSTAALLDRIPMYGGEGLGGLLTGPDGAVWVGRASRVARIDPVTFSVVEYPFPPSTYTAMVRSLVNGPDGALWFVNGSMAHRLRMNGTLTSFPLLGTDPAEIVRGTDDNFWVLGAQTFQQLTPTGAATGFGTGGSSLAAAPDGALWFSDGSTGPGPRAVRVTTGGVRSSVPFPWNGGYYFGYSSSYASSAFDADGNLWFARSDRFTRVAVVPVVTGTGLHLVAPCRLVDSRNADGPSGGPGLGPFGARTLVLTGRCGVPAGARSLALNVTAVDVSASGTLSAHPGDVPATGTTVVGLAAGTARAGFATLALGADGTLTVRNLSTGPTGFILDVTGYFK